MSRRKEYKPALKLNCSSESWEEFKGIHNNSEKFQAIHENNLKVFKVVQRNSKGIKNLIQED